MTNVVKKLKTNIKNIKNNKLDVIEEMLSLIILFIILANPNNALVGNPLLFFIKLPL